MYIFILNGLKHLVMEDLNPDKDLSDLRSDSLQPPANRCVSRLGNSGQPGAQSMVFCAAALTDLVGGNQQRFTTGRSCC